MSNRVNQGAYSAPKLIAYGDVREITQNVGSKGGSDGVGAVKSQAA